MVSEAELLALRREELAVSRKRAEIEAKAEKRLGLESEVGRPLKALEKYERGLKLGKESWSMIKVLSIAAGIGLLALGGFAAIGTLLTTLAWYWWLIIIVALVLIIRRLD